MPTLKVSMDRIDVVEDGNGPFEGKGDFYFTMQVQGDNLISVPRENNIGVSAPGSIVMNKSVDVTLADWETLRVSGWVAEADDILSGDDERIGEFDVVYGPGEEWGKGGHQVEMTRKAHVFVHYNVAYL